MPAAAASTHVRVSALPSVTDALRAVESLVLGSGQRTARRNAWTSVLEDRRRAKDRIEAQDLLEAASGRTSRAT
ncbi:SCO2195 family GlnR-regulated protein [Streptomyces termitum]|uniref:SCO2195 family GlnR-regulated protein n=1 Tax=Streptomyces termitum TaxID=67368 RepID=UPI00339E69B6